MPHMTSLEIILDNHHVTKYKFLKVMGVNFSENQHKHWYHKFSGKRKITAEEVEVINSTLNALRIREKVRYTIDRYIII